MTRIEIRALAQEYGCKVSGKCGRALIDAIEWASIYNPVEWGNMTIICSQIGTKSYGRIYSAIKPMMGGNPRDKLAYLADIIKLE